MNVSVIQATAALSANQRWQEMITENLTSASVPGFRKQDLSFSAIQAGIMSPNNSSSISNPYANVALPKLSSSINFEPGQNNYTGVDTNVALEGPGFFEIRMPNGSTAYTRNGEFKLNAQGELINKSGAQVMGDGGPILLDMNGSRGITISPTGEVRQGEDIKGKIKVVDFNNPQLLTPVSQNCFMANNPQLQTTTPADTTMSQSFLESSNTTPILEMSNLLSSMRTYEANQKIVQLSDERAGRAISELGNPS